MRASRDGFVALMDAVIFTAVVMLAMSAVLGLGLQGGEDDRDPGVLLDEILSAEVRMSDLVEGGDGTLVRVSDLCALMLATDQPGVERYLVDLLEAFSDGRGYLLELGFGSSEMSLGDGGGIPVSSAEASVPVTTGGVLEARLSLFAS